MLSVPPGLGTDERRWNFLTEELHRNARERPSSPMTGQAPDWTDGTPVVALPGAVILHQPGGTARAPRIDREPVPESGICTAVYNPAMPLGCLGDHLVRLWCRGIDPQFHVTRIINV